MNRTTNVFGFGTIYGTVLEFHFPHEVVGSNKKRKLLEKARRSPTSLRFAELCLLAEWYGWEIKRQSGTSHRQYQNSALAGGIGEMMNFQDRNGEAKAYKVRQLIDAIVELSLRSVPE